MKDLLVLTQNFPPQISTAGRRPACMVKYLPEFGWRAVVLCVDSSGESCGHDPDFVTSIPDEVYIKRVKVIEKKQGFSNINLFNRIFRPHVIPQDYIRQGKQVLPNLAKNFNLKAVWATAPSASTHVLANWAHKALQVPWLADFRDVIGQNTIGVKASVVDSIRLRHEKRYTQSAAEFITVSEGLAEILQSRYNRSVKIVPNGFDPDDLNPDDQCILEKFSFVFTGGAILGRPDFLPLLDAVGNLIENRKVNQNEVSIEFYGNGNRERLTRMFASHKYRSLVNILDAVPWKQCRSIQRQAAVLIQPGFPGKKGLITSKIFEYLAAGRPILCINSDRD